MTDVSTLLKPTPKVKPLTPGKTDRMGYGHCVCCNTVHQLYMGMCLECQTHNAEHHAELLAFVRDARALLTGSIMGGFDDWDDKDALIARADELLGEGGEG